MMLRWFFALLLPVSSWFDVVVSLESGCEKVAGDALGGAEMEVQRGRFVATALVHPSPCSFFFSEETGYSFVVGVLRGWFGRRLSVFGAGWDSGGGVEPARRSGWVSRLFGGKSSSDGVSAVVGFQVGSGGASPARAVLVSQPPPRSGSVFGDRRAPVTKLSCGGMVVCTAINHCLCDGIGTSQFLHAWAHHTTKPTDSIVISPFHCRYIFKPQFSSSCLPLVHPGFTKNDPESMVESSFSLNKYLQSQPLIPVSLTYTASNIIHLKSQCVPSIKCTTFEVLASHTWRSWVKSLDLAPSLEVKLLFSMNIRDKVNPKIPTGYYGNAFVLACAKTTVRELVDGTLHYVVKLVQEAKSALTNDRVNDILELLEDKNIITDLNASLVISQWSKLGLEDLDFGEGKPLHMGPLTSDIYCLFLPIIGDSNAIRVLVSMPKAVINKFKHYMNDFLDSTKLEAK